MKEMKLQAHPVSPDGAPILEVTGLQVDVRDMATGGWISAVDDVRIRVGRGERVGLVGESGSGKSLIAQALMGLFDGHNLRARGEMGLDGRRYDLSRPERWRAVRGQRIGLVFQDPLAALDPLQRVGTQVVEALAIRKAGSRRALRARAIDLLRQVGIPEPAARVDAYPHELSGGMRQRVCIAAALACDPVMLIADEPTTALDVTVQVQVLELLARLQEERGMGVLLISHDLGLVSRWCDRVHVLYAGEQVESGTPARVLTRPRHPYTAALLASLPTSSQRGARLPELPGRVPELGKMPAGCRFHPRCPRVDARCRTERPSWTALGEGTLRCHHPLEGASWAGDAPRNTQAGVSSVGSGGMRSAAGSGPPRARDGQNGAGGTDEACADEGEAGP